VQEHFPAGWVPSVISHDGCQIKGMPNTLVWIFLDLNPRALSYSITPPNAATSTASFSGAVESSGDNGFASHASAGLSKLPRGICIPSDTAHDWFVSMRETLEYLHAYSVKDASKFPGVTVNRLAYVYRTMLLRQFKRYRDIGSEFPTDHPQHPNRWIPVA
jgi:hypothetical protein